MSDHGSPHNYGQPESPTEEYNPQYYDHNQQQNNSEDLGPPASPDGSPDYANEYPDAPLSNQNVPQSPEQEGPQSPDFDYEDNAAPKSATPEVAPESPVQGIETVERYEPQSPDAYIHEYSEEGQGPKTPEQEAPINDEDDSPTKHRRIVLSDDEDEEEAHQQTDQQDGAEAITHLDLSDDSDDEAAKPAEVQQLMTNIFGEDSDDEGERQEGDQDQRGYGDEEGGYDDEKEWDFDRIMEEKKRERGKKRKRRKDGSIDLCSNADGQIRHVVELMKSAAAEDREANNQRRPAIQKTKMLEVVRSILLRADYLEAFFENDMMSAISEWLAPLPDKSLPALEIRTTLLKILSSFPHLEPGILKQSGLGKAVMLIFKHPKETRENKIMASKLIRNWSQPIFQISSDYSSISRDEREAFDFEHLPEAKRRKLDQHRVRANEAGSSRSTQAEEPILNPGDPGFINRARVPKASTSAYIIRPKPNVEGNFRGPTKNRQNSRFDRTQRDFKERTRSSKNERAIGVSIEGRRMD